MKFRIKWCPTCKDYLPPRGASYHKCLYKGTVFIGESQIKCCWYDKKTQEGSRRQVPRNCQGTGYSPPDIYYGGHDIEQNYP